jgi:hypothetical protein
MKNLLIFLCLIFVFTSCVSHKPPCYTKKTKQQTLSQREIKRFTKIFMRDLDKQLSEEEKEIINSTNIIFDYK